MPILHPKSSYTFPKTVTPTTLIIVSNASQLSQKMATFAIPATRTMAILDFIHSQMYSPCRFAQTNTFFRSQKQLS
jgi:hypothetical protein